MAEKALLTIGALAARARVSTSMLRFYEHEGLLRPARRSRSGYRLYRADAEQTLLFIRRAQRLGLSLEDIRVMLAGQRRNGIAGRTVVGIAEQRFLEIERRLTELMVLRHERERIFAALRGQHVHVWRDGDGYTVLMPGQDPAVAAALRQLRDAESECAVHVDLTLTESGEGQLLTARGAGAFLVRTAARHRAALSAGRRDRRGRRSWRDRTAAG